MENTILERVAQVIRDLKMMGVVKQEDKMGFMFSRDIRGYDVRIKLSNLSTREIDDDLETIRRCFNDEFQKKLEEDKGSMQHFEYKCKVLY